MQQLQMAYKRQNGFKKALIAFLFFLVLLAPAYSGMKDNSNISEKLLNIPHEDRQELIDFFRGMLSQGDFAAVLFDLKPASLHDWPWWCVQYPEKNHPVRNHLLLTYKGWTIWSKYASLFDLKYLFVDQGYHDEMFTVWFVKKNYINSIKAYLQENPSGIEKHRKLGTMLGFDEKDVEGFCEERELELVMEYLPFDSQKLVGSSEPREKIADLLKKYSNTLPEHLTRFEQGFFFQDFCSPVERFFPSGVYGYRSFSRETKDQTEWKQKVADLYNSENFLEEILTLMTES